MSGYLDRLEQQLIEATNANASSRRGDAVRRHRIPGSAAAALVALLLASAVALAVTGTFNTGTAVRPPGHPTADAGAGVAVRGTHMLATRVVDPAGDLPWGMRLVKTSRHLVCLQVGRIQGTQLGVLGQDGAYGDDGRFHPVAPNVVGYHRETTELSTCLQSGESTSLEARIPESGVFGSPHSEAIPPGARRWLSYGLLGPAAISITYRYAGQTHTIPVEPGSGAYLVVLPSPQKSNFETGGGASSVNGFVTPQGVVRSIAYRVEGKTCDESSPANEAAAVHPQCPRPPVASPPRAPRHLNRRLNVQLAANGTAVITFKAPYAVSSALSDYIVEIPSPCHQGTIGTPVERDLRAGETVHVIVHDIFANACGPSVPVRVVYETSRNRFQLGQPEIIVGRTTIRR